jgi:hypothetical protein
MTDREKAIVMAYTGIAMLTGEKLNVFYEYLDELYGRPVYTHEIAMLDIQSKCKPDFVELCRKEEPEIVRCKDCKRGRPYNHTKEYVSCEVDCDPIDRDSVFFCAYGERRGR